MEYKNYKVGASQSIRMKQMSKYNDTSYNGAAKEAAPRSASEFKTLLGLVVCLWDDK